MCKKKKRKAKVFKGCWHLFPSGALRWGRKVLCCGRKMRTGIWTVKGEWNQFCTASYLERSEPNRGCKRLLRPEAYPGDGKADQGKWDAFYAGFSLLRFLGRSGSAAQTPCVGKFILWWTERSGIFLYERSAGRIRCAGMSAGYRAGGKRNPQRNAFPGGRGAELWAIGRID